MLLIKRKMTLIYTFQKLNRHPNIFSVVEYPAVGLIQGQVSFISLKLHCGSYSRAGLIQGRVSFKDLRYTEAILLFAYDLR